MQIVEQKLEQSISEKLIKLPVDNQIAFFVNQDEANYARTRISELHKTTPFRFKTKKGVQDNSNGIFIWKIKE